MKIKKAQLIKVAFGWLVCFVNCPLEQNGKEVL